MSITMMCVVQRLSDPCTEQLLSCSRSRFLCMYLFYVCKHTHDTGISIYILKLWGRGVRVRIAFLKNW